MQETFSYRGGLPGTESEAQTVRCGAQKGWDQAATTTNVPCANLQCCTSVGKRGSWLLGHVRGWMTQLSWRR